MRTLEKTRTAAAVLTALAAAVALWPAPAGAATVTKVATRLDNPRGLAFAPDGSLWIAEAGRGGKGPCFAGPEGGESCYGTSSALTRVRNGKQKRVLANLPSIASTDGSGAVGLVDVAFGRSSEPALIVGLGGSPATRERLPASAHKTMGWLLRGKAKTVADVTGYEASANPDGAQIDSNPNAVTVAGKTRAVIDAGGNSLISVDARGRMSTIAVFPGHPPLPEGEGEDQPLPIESVPTSVARGPDGAYYVGELTGFPFVPRLARIFRVVPGEAPEVFASGFTNVIDVAFGRDGSLYVLELATNGLMSGDPTGALVRIGPDGSRQTIMSDGLTYPAGLAVRGRAAYVSNCGMCPGTGEVLKIPL